MKESGLLPSVMISALGQRGASAETIETARTEGVAHGRPNRGVPPSEARWELKASFTLEEVKAMQEKDLITKWCGRVSGTRQACWWSAVEINFLCS